MDRGALHRRLGIKSGQKISTKRIRRDLAKAKRKGDIRAERQDVQALNFRGAGRHHKSRSHRTSRRH